MGNNCCKKGNKNDSIMIDTYSVDDSVKREPTTKSITKL